jgi:hypothetical protein
MTHTENTKDPRTSQWDDLKTLRDEIRLEIHLAGMDLRDEWQRIERELPSPSRMAEDLGTAASEGLDHLVAELRRFQTKLRDKAASRARRSG